jgi:transposase
MERLYVTEGMTMSEIAAHLNTAKSNVQLWITEYGIPKRLGAPPSVRPTRSDLVSDLQTLGSQTAVAEKYGVTRPAVSVWCKHYDLTGTVDGRKTRHEKE